MKRIKNFFILAIVSISSIFVTPLNIVHAESKNADVEQSLQNFLTPNTNYFWNIATVDLPGIKRNDLFNFVTDVRNDALWYPGVVGVTRLSGDNSKGTVYAETINLGGGFQYTDNVNIEAYKQNHFNVEVSNGGPVNSWGYLVFDETKDGASLTIVGVVPQNPFLNQDLLKEFTYLAYGSLGSYLHTTSTITYTDGAFTTPATSGDFSVPFSLDIK